MSYILQYVERGRKIFNAIKEVNIWNISPLKRKRERRYSCQDLKLVKGGKEEEEDAWKG